MTAQKTGLGAETARRVHDAAVAYVPRILLETLASHPSRAIPWCEWVDGTLVMADVSGFTAMSERLAKAGKEGAEWLTDIINWYFGRMLEIASGCGGTTLTFGGDAILLLFYGEDHERRAIAASLRMLHATEELPAYRVANHRVKLAMSMGAHAGRFLTASVGTNDHAQYLILGPETVKTAQAEAQASSGELAITAEMAERVTASAVIEPLGEFFRVGRLVNTPRYAPVVQKVPGAVPPWLLAAYLPPFVSDVLRCDPEAPAPVVDHEHRNVTVAFVNVLGVDDVLTAGGEDALLEEIQRCVEPIARLADEHNGYLVSNDIYTNGFKLIASFGAPASREHDAANALRFSVAVQERIAGDDLHLTCRIGVNGGFVYAGDVGPPYRRQYTVMGDAVNLAARLMSAAEAGQVLVSSRTGEAAGEGFLARELTPIRVKGKERPIPIRLVDGLCATAVTRPIETGPLYGRDAELAVLDRARSDVGLGQGRIVLIRGEAGMGKSRLAAACESAAAGTGWTAHVGRAYEHRNDQPFVPWVSILGSILGFTVDDDDASRTEKALTAVSVMDPNFVEWACLLDPLLGLSIPQTDLVRSLDATSQRERLFDLVAGLVSRAADRGPVLIRVEDAHWADRSSLELLEHVARGTSCARVLLLVTERCEGAPELDLPPSTTVTIDLDELPRSAALDVMRQALGQNLPEAAMEVLLRKTRGNPLYLQEVARSIDRSGLEACGSDEAELARHLAGVEVPDRIQGLIMSSIDSLSQPAREVLRMASVVGTTFDVATLQGSFSGVTSSSRLDEALSDLVSQSMLLAGIGSGARRAYDFRHALIREVAYDSLAFAKRRRMHHQVAECLEVSHEADLEAVYESLVHHYQLSRDSAKTSVFAVKAAEKARRLLAHDEALHYYRVGLESVGARTKAAAFARGYLMEQAGDCMQLTGQYRHAAEAYKDARRRCRPWDTSAATGAAALLALPEMPPARTGEATLCHKVGVAYTRTHCDFSRSLAWLDRAYRALPPREPELSSRIDATRSTALLWTGANAEAMRYGRRAFATARRLGARELQARASVALGVAAEDVGNVALATRYGLRSLDLYREVGDLTGQAQAHSNVAGCYILSGNLGSALRHALEALRIDERLGNLTGMAISNSNVAEILEMRGDLDEAVRHAQVALESSARTRGGATTVAAHSLLVLTRVHTRSGRLEEAAAHLEESVALFRKGGATTFLAETRLQRATIHLMAGEPAQALAQCERGLREARELGMKMVELRGLRLRGRIASAEGDLVAAERFLRDAVELAKRLGAPYELGLALLDLAEARAAAGREYGRVLTASLARLEASGATPDIERARALEAAHA
jgi:class 3 adenylate cyclase/tetratricopeptide (TPR) repeat protein